MKRGSVVPATGIKAPNIQRVLMTTDTVGGVWTFAMSLCETLAARGVEVILAAMGGLPTDGQRAAASRIPRLRLHTSEYRLEWMNDPWEDQVRSTKWLLDLEKRYSPDVIHLNSFGILSGTRQTPVVVTAHSCVASWWKAVRNKPLGQEWSRYVAHVKQCLKAATLVVAPSEVMLDSLADNYGLSSSSTWTDIIPNGSRPDRYFAQPKESFVLGAGRLWDEAKGMRTLAEAAAQLPWPVLLAGETLGVDGEKAQFPGCRMLGRLAPDELSDLYGRAAIFAHPARYEPFGLSVLEAALSGCALVLGDIPSLREIWRNTAIFVRPDSPAALAAAIDSLVKTPRRREELAALSSQRAHRFTTEQMGTHYMNAYERVIRGRYACAS